MKGSLAGAGGLIAAVLVAAAPAGAHHSFGMFDKSKEVTLDGTVKEFQYTNPHSWTQLLVMEDGKQVEYGIEGGSPNGLGRRGWNKNSLKPGDKVKLVMNPMRDGSKGGSFVRAIFPDGHTLTGQ